MLEKQFQSKVRKYLLNKKENTPVVINYVASSKYTEAGVPDLLCCINGYFVGIELKMNGTGYGATNQQIIALKNIRKAGGYSFILRPEENYINVDGNELLLNWKDALDLLYLGLGKHNITSTLPEITW